MRRQGGVRHAWLKIKEAVPIWDGAKTIEKLPSQDGTEQKRLKNYRPKMGWSKNQRQEANFVRRWLLFILLVLYHNGTTTEYSVGYITPRDGAKATELALSRRVTG